MVFNESTSLADPEGLVSHGFVDVTPEVHAYLSQHGGDVEITPIYYNPQSKQYGVFAGKGGLFHVQDNPQILPTVNGPSSLGGQILDAVNNLKFPLAVFTAGGTFATNPVVTEAPVIDISPDLLEGGEGADIFSSQDVFINNPDLIDQNLQTATFGSNPTIADLENGGEGAGLPGTLNPTQSFPDLKTIATGAKTVLDLATANKIAQAQVANAQAQRAASLAAPPSRLLPNFASFLSRPGGTLAPTGGASVTGVSAYVIAGIILVLGFLFLKR